MNRALEDLSKSDLISLLKEKEKSVSNLQHRLLKKDQIIAQFQRMLFGQKRERFEGDPAQGSLPFEATGQQKQEQETLYEKAISYVRKRKSAPNHKGRLPLPDHLPVEELEIHPEGDLQLFHWQVIGQRQAPFVIRGGLAFAHIADRLP